MNFTREFTRKKCRCMLEVTDIRITDLSQFYTETISFDGQTLKFSMTFLEVTMTTIGTLRRERKQGWGREYVVGVQTRATQLTIDVCIIIDKAACGMTVVELRMSFIGSMTTVVELEECCCKTRMADIIETYLQYIIYFCDTINNLIYLLQGVLRYITISYELQVILQCNQTRTATSTLNHRSANPCNNCNKTIIVDETNFPVAGTTYKYWASQNYPNNYPDGCYCCLNIQLIKLGFVFITFNSGDAIHQVGNCNYDKLQFFGDYSTLITVCDSDMSVHTNFLTKVNPNEKITGLVCFTSDPGDGNTVAKGFNMTIEIQTFLKRDSMERALHDRFTSKGLGLGQILPSDGDKDN
ncbi:uncharacterized protein LOC135212870 [Macrobrachium nipponense]|uniref:uncharacterized protein LOC135212870 n=1 Tax=Macrobrachium nipponense TaxID=159736 RepID=UPI0030C88F76